MKKKTIANASLSETPAMVLNRYAGRTVRNAVAINAARQSRSSRTRRKKKTMLMANEMAG